MSAQNGDKDKRLLPITNAGDKRVVVAMSGGVDSSVAAAILVEQGFDVVGMMMRLWSEPGTSNNTQFNRCCTPDQMADARRVADQLGIPFYALDVKEHFRDRIVQFFINEHVAGKTPNPCIECNRQIRFTYLLEQAFAIDAHYLATGHYARVTHKKDCYKLLKGVDQTKDQSYVLHVLTQKKLAHVLFPIGNYHKDEVRDLARKFNLPVAAKHDSQDLCFVADGDYRRFLRQNNADVSRPGMITSESGQELGQHNGLPFYTIGQRKGLGITSSHPLYVINKDTENNNLIVGSREALGQTELLAQDVNWIAGHSPDQSKPVQIKIRYKAKPVPGMISDLGHGKTFVNFNEPVFGITPGQGAVFYDNDICLGGGLITDSPHIQPTVTSGSSDGSRNVKNERHGF